MLVLNQICSEWVLYFAKAAFFTDFVFVFIELISRSIQVAEGLLFGGFGIFFLVFVDDEDMFASPGGGPLTVAASSGMVGS